MTLAAAELVETFLPEIFASSGFLNNLVSGIKRRLTEIVSSVLKFQVMFVRLPLAMQESVTA
jgi:hypothetical protein